MKTYLPTETKEERKARKLLERQNKLAQIVPVSSSGNRYVTCLKWGNKYSPEYVNRLYNMVQRNLTLDYEFVCFTDSSQGIDKHIRVEPLPKMPVIGWWYKPYFFSADLPLKGTVLFLDLDMIVFKNINELFSYKQGKFCIIRDFNRKFRPNWNYMNSSVFRLETGMFDYLWEDFKRNPAAHLQKNRGDQDWMYRYVKGHEFWPDEWIRSYKWEMRDRNKLAMISGKRNFIDIADPIIQSQNKIAVFHGDPNPADCKDPWVVDNWQ
jgi:hypothetical protein